MNNAWSCSVQAAAKVMRISTQELIDEIGHDGGALVFPELPEPMCRAGFHIQEIQDAAVRLGYAVMTIETRPQATPNGVDVREVFDEVKLKERIKWYMFYYNGIAVGQRHGRAAWHYNFWLCGEVDKPVWYDAGGRELKTPNIAIAYLYAFMRDLSR